jgi:hypothetical protein
VLFPVDGDRQRLPQLAIALRLAGVSPLPTTGSSQLKPMYQLFASIVVGSLMPFSRYSFSFFLSSPIATIIAVP